MVTLMSDTMELGTGTSTAAPDFDDSSNRKGIPYSILSFCKRDFVSFKSCFSFWHGLTESMDGFGFCRNVGDCKCTHHNFITVVVGSGVLSLSLAIAQLGWIVGPSVLLLFSVIIWFTSTLLADCCRDPVSGRRCSCYMDAVKSNLGDLKICYLIFFAFS